MKILIYSSCRKTLGKKVTFLFSAPVFKPRHGELAKWTSRNSSWYGWLSINNSFNCARFADWIPRDCKDCISPRGIPRMYPTHPTFQLGSVDSSKKGGKVMSLGSKRHSKYRFQYPRTLSGSVNCVEPGGKHVFFKASWLKNINFNEAAHFWGWCNMAQFADDIFQVGGWMGPWCFMGGDCDFLKLPRVGISCGACQPF